MIALVGRRTLSAYSIVGATRTAATAGFTTSAGSRPSARVKGGFLPAAVAATAVAAPSLTALALLHTYYSTSSVLLTESTNSCSSSLFRTADGAALRKPASQLLFMSYKEEHRDEWQGWIGYFRQAGYDCIDLNVALESEEATNALAEELSSQVGLMSLQRAPLLFAYSGTGAQIALDHIQSDRAKVSGLVLLTSDERTVQAAGALDRKKLRILVLKAGQEDKEALRTVERWMDTEGLS